MSDYGSVEEIKRQIREGVLNTFKKDAKKHIVAVLRRLLAIPACSAASERSFSAAESTIVHCWRPTLWTTSCSCIQI